jgi:transcriptional repressor NrdR
VRERFTTYEYIETTPSWSSRRTAGASRSSAISSKPAYSRPCEKRPISPETIDEIVDGVESVIQKHMRSEVTSRDVGEA